MNIISRKINDYEILEYKKSHIYLLKNIFEDELCDHFIDFIEKVPKKKNDYFDGNNVQCYSSNLNDLFKIDDKLHYYFNYNEDVNKNITLSNNLNGIKHNDIKKYIETINRKQIIIENIMKNINNKLVFNFNDGYVIRKIFGATKLHIDGLKQIFSSKYIDPISFCHDNDSDIKSDMKYFVRNNTVIISLNDNYEGGIFNFPYYNISLKLPKGSALIFPSFWTHEHEVTSVKNNSFRYTISIWNYELTKID